LLQQNRGHLAEILTLPFKEPDEGRKEAEVPGGTGLDSAGDICLKNQRQARCSKKPGWIKIHYSECSGFFMKASDSRTEEEISDIKDALRIRAGL
jgi:hypothetical protein